MRYLIDLLLLSLSRRTTKKQYQAPCIQPYECQQSTDDRVLNDEVDLYLIGASHGVIFTSQEVGPLSALAARYDRGEFTPAN